ncbi:SWI/SNF and RSC complexes subunit ssr3 [Schizosaccharomyces pombe]|uniref:SWI/SNF and RSC complexes subunit ssr3 n=1 Tax=Schizosaccharomyces pombe (strain 972 / ATCC 24843) TaxID=284812 RepID=SSR3_SCHPO|nr:SWI/SNF and RSC complex subunit Ssr3 [Schizosaccharomyces pombe]Q9P7S3.1 RecName: Full=SWI/SNF and RSC complexes subunit ssr3 [Schizosaccharomyces pombe 972h-]CAB72235.1 SWI/SNF and RSC complex subunit Ssr3 [Schizosaccharomyces pombe]|eukprot:NP_593110.1 SWI/SNF and RSC complex subunit Ssr3 [Schizosaccharomyces pombe]
MSNNSRLPENGVQSGNGEDAELKKSMRIIEREIPDSLLEKIPEAEDYIALQDLERKLDSLIVRKRFDLQDSLSRNSHKTRILRMYIHSTVANQSWQQKGENQENNSGDINSLPIPEWTLHIEGRLLVNPDDEDDKAFELAPFTNFFRKIAIQILRSDDLYPSGNYVEWNKLPDNSNTSNGITVTRKGDQSVDVKIMLYPEEHPERYKLSKAFANILGIREGTRPDIVSYLWQYIKFHRLQDMEEKRLINCDKALRDLFEADRLYFPRIPELMNRFLEPIDPIVIPYTINVSEHTVEKVTIFDIRINTEDPRHSQIRSFLATMMSQDKIRSIDDKLTELIQAITYSQSKYDFMKKFSESPIEFINEWIESQSRDLEIVLDGTNMNYAEKRSADYYQQPWVHESAFHYLNLLNSKKQQSVLNASAKK